MVKIGEFDNFGVEDMSGGDYEKKRAELQKKCKCPTCPTFVRATPWARTVFRLAARAEDTERDRLHLQDLSGFSRSMNLPIRSIVRVARRFVRPTRQR